MTNEIARLSVQIDPHPDADTVELEELTDQLRRELMDLNVESVERKPEAEAPAGAKAAEGFAIGGLIIKLAPTLVGVVARTVQRWLQRSTARSVELTIGGDNIKLTNASREDQERLIALLEAKFAGH